MYDAEAALAELRLEYRLRCRDMDVADIMPIVHRAVADAKAEVWELAASFVGQPFEQEFRDRAAHHREAAGG